MKKIVLIVGVWCLLLTGCLNTKNKSISEDSTEKIEKTVLKNEYDGKWVETNDGKRYKLKDGLYLTNKVARLDDSLYYFNSNGYLDQNKGWKKIDNEWCYINDEGIAVSNCWIDCYYLFSDGKTRSNTYINRFYLGKDSKWENNSWSSENWKVDGRWEKDNDEWFFIDNNGKKQKIQLDNLRTIARLGYDVRSNNAPPEQSIESYDMAIEKGYNIILCDLRFTKDNVAVCFHDSSINRIARKSDGSEIVRLEDGEELTDDMKIFLQDYTYEQLCQYDYGIYKGEKYAGGKILTLKDMLNYYDNKGIELYIEIKEGTHAQIKQAVRLADKYNINVSWAGTTLEQCKAVIENDNKARIATMPNEITKETIQDLLSLKTGQNEVFFFAYGNTILTDKKVKELKKNNIAFEMGTIESAQELLNYYNGDYYYCSGIETSKVVASKINLDKYLNR